MRNACMDDKAFMIFIMINPSYENRLKLNLNLGSNNHNAYLHVRSNLCVYIYCTLLNKTHQMIISSS